MVFYLNLWPISQQSVNTGCLQGEVRGLASLMINSHGNEILWCFSLNQRQVIDSNCFPMKLEISFQESYA